MTTARQQRKSRAAAVVAKMGLGFLLSSGLIGELRPLWPAQAATTERIVADPRRGLALSGFDPVAYFTDSKPMLGRGEIEYAFAGVTWRFRNEGNRAAFAEHPEIYTPTFGGYDPVAVARGVAAPGHPQIWAIVGERLYLFYNLEARNAFAADPDSVIAMAEKRWPAVVRTLVP
jgi:YHS domain-containing protein